MIFKYWRWDEVGKELEAVGERVAFSTWAKQPARPIGVLAQQRDMRHEPVRMHPPLPCWYMYLL